MSARAARGYACRPGRHGRWLTSAHPSDRFSRERPRFIDTLDVIKFLCKDMWTLVFRKQIDNLKTNHRVRPSTFFFSFSSSLIPALLPWPTLPGSLRVAHTSLPSRGYMS